MPAKRKRHLWDNRQQPVTSAEEHRLQEWDRISPSKLSVAVYRGLRAMSGQGELKVTDLADQFNSNVTRVNASLDWLEECGLVSHCDDGRVRTWIVYRVPRVDRGKRGSFRGRDVIRVESFVRELGKRHIAGLFSTVPDDLRAVALYRALHELAVAGQPVVLVDLAATLDVNPETLHRGLKRLYLAALVEADYEKGVLRLAVPPEKELEGVDAEALQRYLDHPSLAQCPVRPTYSSKKVRKAASQARLLLQFYDDLVVAHSNTRNMLTQRAMGAKEQGTYAIHNLLKGVRPYSVEELAELLVYYVTAWNGPAAEKYGKTLRTFAKQLDVIREECSSFGPEYVLREVKRLGLYDEWDFLFKAADTRVQQTAERLEKRRAEMSAKALAEVGGDWGDDDIEE